MSGTVKKGIFFAVAAAALYAINSPLSKLLLDYVPSTLMAAGAWLCSQDKPIFAGRKSKRPVQESISAEENEKKVPFRPKTFVKTVMRKTLSRGKRPKTS